MYIRSTCLDGIMLLWECTKCRHHWPSKSTLEAKRHELVSSWKI
jgi:hypothetical protein